MEQPTAPVEPPDGAESRHADPGALAAEAVGAPNPVIGVSGEAIARSLGNLIAALALRPDVLAAESARLGLEALAIAAGRSKYDLQTDRRFAHPAWRTLPYRPLGEFYLAWRESMYRTFEQTLRTTTAERARLVAGILAEAPAPTNTLLGNPAALARAWRTRGRSVVDGVRHMARDLQHNGAMPALLKPGAYQVGVDLAVTPGAVVHRTPMYELIQYAPQSRSVHATPLLMVASPVNKYYFLDLAPGRSLVEYALRRGFQFFAVSWRNPTASQAEWGMDAYAAAAAEAADVAAAISGSQTTNLLGVCAGGIMTAQVLAGRVAAGLPLPAAATFLVAGLDNSWPSSFGWLATMTGAELAVRRSRRSGRLPGQDLQRAFALLRPNELIWGMWVNNYVLGNDPPGTDILAWNTDLTNLPAALHADMTRMLTENPLGSPDGSVDLGKVDCDTYTLGGLGDHIVPWQSCYRSAQLFGGRTRFVTASAGHIQSLVNPPGHPRSRYRTGPEQLPAEPDEWMAASTEHQGTWWDDWLDWLAARSGPTGPAPALGSEVYPPLLPAPGRYIHQVAS